MLQEVLTFISLTYAFIEETFFTESAYERREEKERERAYGSSSSGLRKKVVIICVAINSSV